MQLSKYVMPIGIGLGLGAALLPKMLGTGTVARITAVTCGPTGDVAQGMSVSITATIKNIGSVTHEFGCAMYAKAPDGTTVPLTGCIPIELAPGASIDWTYTWTIPETQATGLYDISVEVYEGAACTGTILAFEICPDIINVISGVAAEITSITVTPL